MNLDRFLEFLDTYKGRDRFLRLLAYGSKFASGLSSPHVGKHLDKLSSQLSTSRAAFRLLDDLPAVVYLFSYGFGKKGEDKLVRLLNAVGNVVDVIFCPIDHICWAIEHSIIVSKNTVWDLLNISLWVASLYLHIMSSLRKIGLILDQKKKLMERQNKNSDEMDELSRAQFRLSLSTLKSVMDIMFAVNYLPPGFLWSGRLSKWQVGALGTASSAIALYQSLV